MSETEFAKAERYWRETCALMKEKKILRQALARAQTRIHSDVCGKDCCRECDHISDVLDNQVTPDATQATDDTGKR